MNNPPSRTLGGIALGATTGFSAGLIGVGGGEFRLPGLLHLLRDVRITAAVNMVVGLATVTLSLGRRSGTVSWEGEWLWVAAASLAGVLVGTAVLPMVEPPHPQGHSRRHPAARGARPSPDSFRAAALTGYILYPPPQTRTSPET
jgi:uncharacterized membrane protein YfcA